MSEFRTDQWIYRIIVGVLGLLVLSVALGGLGLAMFSGKASLKVSSRLALPPWVAW
jgi:hypothetical protein